MIRAALIAFALLALPVGAAEPMSEAEFRDFTEGWTLHFENEAGVYYGSEQYLPGNRTIWLPTGGRCEHGVWAGDRDGICFLYESGASCWRVFTEPDEGLVAVNSDGVLRLRLKARLRAPVLCPEEPGV